MAALSRGCKTRIADPDLQQARSGFPSLLFVQVPSGPLKNCSPFRAIFHKFSICGPEEATDDTTSAVRTCWGGTCLYTSP